MKTAHITTLVFLLNIGFFIVDNKIFSVDSVISRRINQIYVINLDLRQDRWIDVFQQLQKFEFHPVRFSAINGWEMDRRELKNFYRTYVKKSQIQYLTPGQLGCFLSHLTVLKNAFSQMYECIWVLEDDIVVLRDLNELDEIIEKLNVFDPDWDLLFTDVDTRGLTPHEIWTFDMFLGNYFDYSLVKDVNFIAQENKDFKRIEYRLGTHSMIISYRGIKKLLEYFENHKILFPVDVQMHCCPDKRFYVSKKEFVTHGERHGSDTSFKPIF